MKKNNRIFIMCYLSYAAIYVARLNLSMASPAFKEMQLLTSTQIGLLGSVFSVVYAMGRLLNGVFGDRKPPRVMICFGLALAGLSNLLIGFLPPFVGILLFWSVNAFAQSMLWSSVLCVVAQLYDAESTSTKTSLMVTSVATGNIIGILINLYLIEHFGVRWAFIIPGAITLLCGAINMVLLRALPATPKTQKPHMNMLQLLRNAQIRTSIGSSMIHGVMKDNITLWMTVFFVDRFAVNLETSAYFVLFIPVVGFVGRSLYTPVYRLCGKEEHRVSVYGFAVCAVCAGVLCLPVLSPVVAMVCLSVIYAAVSMINTSFLSIYPLRYLESGNVASVSGVLDFSTYLGAGIASLCYGVIIEYFGYVPMFVSWLVLSTAAIGLARALLRSIRTAEQTATE